MQVFTVFETFSERKGNTKAPRFCTKRDFYLTLEMNLNELLLNRVLNVSAVGEMHWGVCGLRWLVSVRLEFYGCSFYHGPARLYHPRFAT